MPRSDYIILGGTGLIGLALVEYFESRGKSVLSIHSKNYNEHINAEAGVLINCNGNTYRYKANQDPIWDFEASVISVDRSLFDYNVNTYVYISTIDVYSNISDPQENKEDAKIDLTKLDAYGFHKWMAERLVERYAQQSVILRTGTVLGKNLKKGPIYDLLYEKPIQMAEASELSFVDTSTIAQAIEAILKGTPNKEIFNLTATGSARLTDLIDSIETPVHFSKDVNEHIYKYNINNEKLCSVMPVQTSMETAMKFIRENIHAVDKK